MSVCCGALCVFRMCVGGSFVCVDDCMWLVNMHSLGLRRSVHHIDCVESPDAYLCSVATVLLHTHQPLQAVQFDSVFFVLTAAFLYLLCWEERRCLCAGLSWRFDLFCKGHCQSISPFDRAMIGL